ncbi:MAG: hypothetical protein RLZZ188_3523 [Verrucomicrobiota bacterium]
MSECRPAAVTCNDSSALPAGQSCFARRATPPWAERSPSDPYSERPAPNNSPGRAVTVTATGADGTVFKRLVATRS